MCNRNGQDGQQRSVDHIVSFIAAVALDELTRVVGLRLTLTGSMFNDPNPPAMRKGLESALYGYVTQLMTDHIRLH